MDLADTFGMCSPYDGLILSVCVARNDGFVPSVCAVGNDRLVLSVCAVSNDGLFVFGTCSR